MGLRNLHAIINFTDEIKSCKTWYKFILSMICSVTLWKLVIYLCPGVSILHLFFMNLHLASFKFSVEP